MMCGEKGFNKVVNCIALGSVLLGFIVTTVIVFWSTFPYNPLVIDGHAQILNKEVKAGDDVIYRLKYCKHMDIPVTIRRRFIDGLVYQIPESTIGLNQVGCKTQDIAIEVPAKLPPGEYELYTEFVYQVNPIRQVIIKDTSEGFTVL